MQSGQLKNSIRWAALVLATAIFTGCATDGASKKQVDPPPDTTAAAIAESNTKAITENATVTLLNDSRDGFIINEAVTMDGTQRSAFERAVSLLDNGQNEAAIDILETIVETSPHVTAPYINLGMAYQRAEKADKAEAQFKKALELMPGHPVACNQLGLLCRKAGRFDEALAMYEQALAGYPNYYPVHRNLGILCDLYLNDPESALAHYQTYSQAMPDEKQVKIWIADLKARLGK